jgi:RNA polymerase sigma-70 factor (ECF subfamily)
MLRARKVRIADAIDDPAKHVAATDTTLDPEQEAMLGDAVGAAMLVVLDRLGPAERVAFVLHDTFGVPFDQIAAIVGRSTEATRQLASRARNRVRGADASGRVTPDRRRELVTAFLAAARLGEFDRLLAILDPDVVLIPDAAAEKMGTPAGLRGSRDVAGVFSGRAQAAQPALVNGLAGLVWATGGTPRVVFVFTLDDDRIVRIDTIANSDRIAELDVELLDG